MTDKKQKPAHNAKIITTGIAIAATFGVQTAYAISSNIAKATAQIAQTEVAPVVATDPAVAPTQPGPATPQKQKGSTTTQNVAPTATGGTITAVTDTVAPVVGTSPVVQTPSAQPAPTSPSPVVTTAPVVTVAPVPTTAPKTSSSK